MLFYALLHINNDKHIIRDLIYQGPPKLIIFISSSFHPQLHFMHRIKILSHSKVQMKGKVCIENLI